MNYLLSITLVLVASPAYARNESKTLACEAAILQDSERLNRERHTFEHHVEYFRDELNLRELTSLVTAKKVDVTSLLDTAPDRPRIWAEPAGRRRGRPQIVFTHLRNHTPRRLEEVRWGIARALFDVELEARLADKPPRVAEDGFERRTRRIAEYRLRQVNSLLADLYRVIDQIEHLEVRDLLPKKDPGRPWLPIIAFLKGAPKALSPNTHDYLKYWRTGEGGEAALESAIGDKYDRALVYAAYREQTRYVVNLAVASLGVVAIVGGSAAILPADSWALVNWSAHNPPEVTFSQNDQEAPVRESELTTEQRAALRDNLRRLEDKLVKLSNQSLLKVPTGEIEDTKSKIHNLKNKYPFLMMVNEHPPS